MSTDSNTASLSTGHLEEKKPPNHPMLILDTKLVETSMPASPSPTSPVPAPVFTSDFTQGTATINDAGGSVQIANGETSVLQIELTETSQVDNVNDGSEARSQLVLEQVLGTSTVTADTSMKSASSSTPGAAASVTSDNAVIRSGQQGPVPTTLSTYAHSESTPIQHGADEWPETPRQFLGRLKETVSKAELGNILSKGSDAFHQAVLRLHMESFDFRRDPIDLALRKFLLDFHFPKEAQQIDRVLEAFASRYHACNQHLFRSSDVVYTIAFSLMLLHTDAHNNNVRYKMTKEQYVRQAKSIDGVNTIPADILEILYDNITYLKFVYAEDDMDVDGQRIAEVQSTSSSSWFPRRRTASTHRTDSYSMIRHGSIAHLAPDLSDIIPFRWPYYWKGTVEMVDNVQINNQFTRAPLVTVPGLRLRLRSQTQQQQQQHLHLQFTNAGYEGTYPPLGSRSAARPDIKGHMDDSDIKEQILRSDTTLKSGNEITNWSGKEDEDTDGCAQLRIVKSGILTRKIDIENGKKSSVRGWRDLGVILSGSQLLFFTDTAWFYQQRATQVGFNPQAPPEEDGYFAPEVNSTNLPPTPQALISTFDSIAVVDSSYQKYPHVFRLACPNGKQYLFRAESEHEMNDWMAKINYASAFKTAGVRLRSYRVAWAKDVYWIKDEQGRHQLRRKQKDPSTPNTPTTPMEPLDGRAQLIQAKMKDVDRMINTCSASLASELRLARGLEVMIPLQNSTRQKIVQSATVVGKRLRHLMLERTKLDCFRTILERDLAVVPSIYHSPCDSDITTGEHRMNDDMLASSSALGEASEFIEQGLGKFSNPLSFKQQQQSWYQSVSGLDDNMDHAKDAKEEEYILDTKNTSQRSNHSSKSSSRPRLNLPEIQRSVSEDTLDERHRACTIKNVDIPMRPSEIQAAIINAARGHHRHHLHHHYNNNLSNPDLNQLHGEEDSNSSAYLSPDHINSQHTTSSHTNISPSSPASSISGGHSSHLSPESSIPRSRALSMPGQRPSMMPRTVSIYSSSSQTANRLRRIFEQGLGHFKLNSSTKSTSSSAPSPVGGGSSLKTSTAYQSDTDED
ncbi:hypothetical protein BX616_010816 [Lobosporangium transversale]|uniref:SEC7 domain-containing protein n=1 Tax=Lobosporangium transversale TaxID=64571 RepID=A0A1Y2GY87_9FUNG|nr:hypothetical protein BCR41DRAFT_420300 [Lobosporangium transversale]KAF9917935.1 hypothetical protein BX616_010816 [Lobosporangium transversale]ORZ23733.1 hypothetical protein BCR41DRAFT_420300 [Lobosporangium transversale]|eukprot:XP_021883547.1 hypothetical protein BCR41DRAFT_420300 [Lobosporangium transversale]